MLGGGDTTASVLVSSGCGGGTDGNVAVASMVSSGGARDGSSTEGGGTVVAANLFSSNGNNSNSGDDERVRVDEGERLYGGNRWPRQETLALLKIRSDMDVSFCDAGVKGPLWEEVSRKLAELGYHRSAKKCKEKFENVFKYHKRTKDGRIGKSDGKTYRFSDQLLALETQLSVQSPATAAAPPPPQLKSQAQPQTTMAAVNNPPSQHINVTVPSATTVLPSLSQNIVPVDINPTIPSFPNVSADLMSDSTSLSDLESEGRRKRKRKWKGFFEKLMKHVVQEQEEMQKKFLEALEKREQERTAREEAWRTQEITRINRERELLAQERSIAAAKDAALMALLQKLSDQQNPRQTQNNLPPRPPVPAVAQAQPAAVAVPAPQPPPQVPQVPNLSVSKGNNGDKSWTPSSSRWPKVEVQALIEQRSRLDNKYLESGPKGPLWEEISGAMKRLGYNRNAKRCKEKWENINKYFKKVKDNQKRRPDDSKTCPYFHQLDALYREKNKRDSSSNQLKPENSVPLMVLPQQQWPPPPSEPYQHQHQRDHGIEDLESDQNQDDEDDKDGNEEEEDEDEDEDEGGEYEIVASRQVSMGSCG